MMNGFGQDAGTGKWWFRPRVRSVGGIGAGSGDTCRTWPGEVVKIQPDPQVPTELVAMPGDFIGDACNAEHLVGGANDAAKLRRLRHATWVGTTFTGDPPLLDEIFVWRRAPQFADNDRDGVGNYRESDWDYASHGAWGPGEPPATGKWNREVINANGNGGDFIAPDRHGVPQPIPGAGTGGGACSAAKADGNRAPWSAGAYLAVLAAVAGAGLRRRFPPDPVG
ncbi:MAG: hypothetical protein KC466_10230 [Myxococcales bacterium]|nr:hypothetical protein [Myxococcales bacterium]